MCAMNRHPLIQAHELAALLDQDRTVVLDCRFDLADTGAGRRAYDAGHLPGALYLHLDDDLSGAKTGRNGRHPLPERSAFMRRLERAGIGDDSHVVVYDAAGGMTAARAWWMLLWIGHADVALLDGGLPAWTAAGQPLETAEPPARPPGRLSERPSAVRQVDRAALLADLERRAWLVVDARASDRFRGENETIDAIGGRIPGAVNRFFRDNLAPDGRFKPTAQLRAEFDAITGGRAPQDLVLSCGSGVTACHDLLALELAGLPGAALYPGSWSEWSSWPDAPVATGGL